MPLQKIVLKPGVNTQLTPTLNESFFAQSQLVRFKDGLPQKWGGWQHLSSTAIIGTARGSHAWADLGGTPYYAVGSEQRLQVLTGGALIDITPLRSTTNPAVNFSTVNTSKTVTVVDAANGSNTGDWVNVIVPVSVGGVVLQGFYKLTVVDANTYTIQSAAAATSTVNNVGAVPSFNTSGAGVTVVTVTLANHGLGNGNLFGVQVATTVGGLLVGVGSYAVSSAATNTFQITPGGSSGSGATVSENAGNAQFQYLITSGLASATPVVGFGTGTYGGGPYGQGSGGALLKPLREWLLDNWGQDLIGNYTNGPAYYWLPPQATSPVAVLVPNGPLFMTASFVSTPTQIFIALGAETGSVQDPNLIRWTDVADFTVWTATAANQAGSFRLPTGSRIVGGIQAGQFGYVWTNIGLWSIQYLGPPLVFGFQEIARGCELIGARAAGVFQNMIFWVSNNNFFMYDGSAVRIIPCAVWDFFFNNLDRNQAEKVHCGVNSWFGEITWFFPSTATNPGECDSYVSYYPADNAWAYGTLARTTWVDENVLGSPIGVDGTGLIQQHEIGQDADGQVMLPRIRTGFLKLAEGSLFTFIERLIADFVTVGGNQRLYINVLVEDFPSDSVITYGPYAWQGGGTGPEYSIVRARGRSFAIEVFSQDLGVFWRWGATRLLTAPAGRR